jgi:prolipoprotein diacylglyceryl transferase
MGYDLKFVNLGIVIEKLSNHIRVFGFDIAYYGIIIGVGMLAGFYIATSDAKRRGENVENYSDMALYGIVFAILGARLYYVIFRWDYYGKYPLEILNIRGGGLAIYGGVIAAVLTLIIFTKKRNLSFFKMADSLVLGLITGQIIGRWGNFFNAEAFGGYTNNLFAMQIKKSIVNDSMISADLMKHLVNVGGVEYIQVHPTFLYESFWNLCVLIFMLWYRKKKKFEGEIFYIYLGGYGLGRMFIEGLRTDSLFIPMTQIPVSQVLAATCFVFSVVMIVRNRRKNKI